MCLWKQFERQFNTDLLIMTTGMILLTILNVIVNLLPGSVVSETCNATQAFKDADKVFEYGDKCAAVFDEEKNWTESRDLCRDGGGELLKISTQADMDRVIVGLGERELCFWIGLNDRDQEGEFRWLDGTPADLLHLFYSKEHIPDDDTFDCFYLCRLKPDPWRWLNRMCNLPQRRLCEFVSVPIDGKEKEAEVWKKKRNVRYKEEYYRKVDYLGEHPYLSADTELSFTTHSVFACCGKCALIDGCLVANVNVKIRSCRLFTSLLSLSQGHEDVPGWEVFAIVM